MPPTVFQPPLRPTAYYRIVRDQGLDWHQWWLWYLYNPGPPAFHGVGRHEGDWEMIQIAETSSTVVLATLSAHHEANQRLWWSCERREGRLVAYVALGSHANYFTPGVYARYGDQNNGKGRVIDDLDVLPFGSWASWRGRWGNSDNSPGGLADRVVWKRPSAAAR
jgi:hypothetical protein